MKRLERQVLFPAFPSRYISGLALGAIAHRRKVERRRLHANLRASFLIESDCCRSTAQSVLSEPWSRMA